MSEYIEIDAELSDDGAILLHTNLKLTAPGEAESYPSPDEMETGSPVAQALAVVDGIASLTMRDGEIVLTIADDADWHAVIADATAALKEFFL
jgi:hypothetical protein